jgi:hypothetical protein
VDETEERQDGEGDYSTRGIEMNWKTGSKLQLLSRRRKRMRLRRMRIAKMFSGMVKMNRKTGRNLKLPSRRKKRTRIWATRLTESKRVVLLPAEAHIQILLCSSSLVRLRTLKTKPTK